MKFLRPFIRFRRSRSESFHDGLLRRTRQHLMFEFGAADNSRGEVAELKQKVDRLTAELVKQKAIVAMMGAQSSRPADELASPACRASTTPIQLFVGGWWRCPQETGVYRLQPEQPGTGKVQATEIFTLIPDENWP